MAKGAADHAFTNSGSSTGTCQQCGGPILEHDGYLLSSGAYVKLIKGTTAPQWKWRSCHSCFRINESGMVTCPFCLSLDTSPANPTTVAETPNQQPLFILPPAPTSTHWKIEWRWGARARALDQTLDQTLGVWFFHSEYKSKRDAENARRRLLRQFGRLKEYRVRVARVQHQGDIILTLDNTDFPGDID